MVKVKGKIGDQLVEYEFPDKALKAMISPISNEKPHVHHSKPHPSKNEKQCDLCHKRVREHYHVCEDCFNFMKESLILRIRELEEEVQKLKKT